MKRCLSSVGLMFIVTAGLFGADNVLTTQEKTAGWVLLFDGKTLNEWDSSPQANGRGRGPAGGARKGGAPQSKGPAQPGAAAQVGSNPRACSTPLGKAPIETGASHWDVVDGSVSPCEDPVGYLTSKESYTNFVLAVDFRTSEDTNSGVFVRGGYEVQIWKAQPAGYNTGSIVGTGKTPGEFKFIPNQWNHFEITADGDHLVVVLNGTKTLDVHDSQFSEGRVRLQYQKFPIEFKNIKLKPIRH